MIHQHPPVCRVDGTALDVDFLAQRLHHLLVIETHAQDIHAACIDGTLMRAASALLRGSIRNACQGAVWRALIVRLHTIAIVDCCQANHVASEIPDKHLVRHQPAQPRGVHAPTHEARDLVLRIAQVDDTAAVGQRALDQLPRFVMGVPRETA